MLIPVSAWVSALMEEVMTGALIYSSILDKVIEKITGRNLTCDW